MKFRTVARPACEWTPAARAARYRASHACAARLVSNVLLDLSEGPRLLASKSSYARCVSIGPDQRLGVGDRLSDLHSVPDGLSAELLISTLVDICCEAG